MNNGLQRKHKRGPVRELAQLEVPGRNEDGTIPLKVLEHNLKVLVADGEDILVGDQLQLQSESFGLTRPRPVTDADKQAAEGNPDFRYELELEQSLFPPPGKVITLALDYFVGVDGVGSVSGKPVDITLDRQPPGGDPLQFLSFTPEQILNGISDDDLTGDNLEVRAQAWFGMEVGDVITPWLGRNDTAGTLLNDNAITVEEKGKPVTVQFPREYMERNGNVLQYFAYQLRDKLGNVSQVSRKRELQVTLGGLQNKPQAKR
ncbi:MAG: hypothetical protein JWQ69_4161 [Pseudomonas sp.]|nr:hypothetical protein [Pseudomonas sp.]